MLTSVQHYHRCSVCNSGNLIEGKMVGSNELVFYLANRGKKISKDSKAVACMDCGHIHLAFNSKSLKIKFIK